jgi:glycosyl transferase family 25
MKFTDFFDRAYVINLPERNDRRREMAEELQNAGMPFTPGKVELFPAIRPDSRGEFQSIGYRGCFLSHLSILKQAREAGLKNVLVMEDDLELRADFKEYEPLILQELQLGNWDIVHFGYNSTQVNQAINQPMLQSFSGEIIGSQFYAVNGRVLNQLIHFFEILLSRPAGHPDGGPMSPDGVLNVFKWQHPDIIRLIAVPSFGGQRSSRSDISPKWFDHVPGLRSLVGVARRGGMTRRAKTLLKPATVTASRCS